MYRQKYAKSIISCKIHHWKHYEFIGNISMGTFLWTSKSCKYLLNTKIIYMYLIYHTNFSG